MHSGWASDYALGGGGGSQLSICLDKGGYIEFELNQQVKRFMDKSALCVPSETLKIDGTYYTLYMRVCLRRVK